MYFIIKLVNIVSTYSCKQRPETTATVYIQFTKARSILVITVAHNPLCASRVPVYTNQWKHSWSIVKLYTLNKLKGNFST